MSFEILRNEKVVIIYHARYIKLKFLFLNLMQLRSKCKQITPITLVRNNVNLCSYFDYEEQTGPHLKISGKFERKRKEAVVD